MKKDVVYIDNDDEIASITDKVQSSPEKIVALVLPKRCTVLQSSVNMKILNKAANDDGKKVVLITSEAGLLPLAGAAGLFVAKTLQSKPAVPAAPQVDDSVESVVEADTDAEPEIDETKSIGELDGDTPEDEDAPIELGDDPEVAKEDDKPKKEKKDKKLAVPNFDSFRIKLFAAIGGIILLIVLWYVLFNVLPKANVVVKIQYKSVPVTLSATGSATATTTDTKAGTVPEQLKTLDKAETKKFSATGEKNNGTKATGTMTVTNCTDASVSLPAGTTFTNNGFSFATDATVVVPGSNFFSNGNCKNDGKVSGITVTSTAAGQEYNLSAGRTYSSNVSSKISGVGSAMGGGTTKIIKVVSASDCDNAKNELLNANTDANKAELESQLKAAGQTPLSDTFAKTSGTATCTPGVDQEATESTATAQLKFTMSGVSTEGLNQLIDAQIQSQLGPNEKIYDNGLSTGKITIKEKKPNGDVAFEFTGTAKVGVKQDSQVIAQTVAGKKYGDSVSAVKSLSGVSDVTITYSPFYVRSTPKDLKKITVTFESQNVSP
jgi:hypothetical protein